MKLLKIFATTIAISSIMATSAFAGVWRTGDGANQGKWWYDNGDGTYANNGWQWIDGNDDGTAECYYFDSDGWMLANTLTPDGYQVNENGAWVNNGIVETQKASIEIPQTPDTTENVSNDISGHYNYIGSIDESGALTNWLGIGDVWVTGISIVKIDDSTIQLSTSGDIVAEYILKKSGNSYIYESGKVIDNSMGILDVTSGDSQNWIDGELQQLIYSLSVDENKVTTTGAVEGTLKNYHTAFQK